MRALSLHHLIAPELTAFELVRLASDLACPYVCVFTQAPKDGVDLPVIDNDAVGDLMELMHETGVRAHGITSFPLLPDTDPTAYLPGLGRGAQLGATKANVRILDADDARVAKNFRLFGDLCEEFGIRPTIEFTGYRKPGALTHALDIIHAAGCGAITLDMLHVVRTGIDLATLEALDPELIGYIQFCDGPLIATAEQYAIEGPYDRLPPGEGEFPLERILAAAPLTLPLSLEVPSRALRSRGLDGPALAARVVASTRSFLSSGDAK